MKNMMEPMPINDLNHINYLEQQLLCLINDSDNNLRELEAHYQTVRHHLNKIKDNQKQICQTALDFINKEDNHNGFSTSPEPDLERTKPTITEQITDVSNNKRKLMNWNINLNKLPRKELCTENILHLGMITSISSATEDFENNAMNQTEKRLAEDKEILAKLPAKYHDFKDVFSKIDADKLPPHRPYDHKIPLKPNTEVPVGPIYNLSQVELKTLYE
ncbi:hypothetical protein, partial, partial [Parasitella parasitica]